MAKDSAEGLSPMEMVGVAISIICALASLVFAYWKWKAEKKRISIQKENAELERTRIESQKEVDKIEAEGKDRHLLLLIFWRPSQNVMCRLQNRERKKEDREGEGGHGEGEHYA